jgi:hypothetical protein
MPQKFQGVVREPFTFVQFVPPCTEPSPETPYLGGPSAARYPVGPSEAGAQYAAGPTPDKGFTGTESNRQSHPIRLPKVMRPSSPI